MMRSRGTWSATPPSSPAMRSEARAFLLDLPGSTSLCQERAFLSGSIVSCTTGLAAAEVVLLSPLLLVLTASGYVVQTPSRCKLYLGVSRTPHSGCRLSIGNTTLRSPPSTDKHGLNIEINSNAVMAKVNGSKS